MYLSGPLPETLQAFWCMVWQERPPTIVMVTNLVEGAKEKCTQFWPEQGSMEVGPFTVTIIDQHKLADCTIRTFILQVGDMCACVCCLTCVCLCVYCVCVSDIMTCLCVCDV